MVGCDHIVLLLTRALVALNEEVLVTDGVVFVTIHDASLANDVGCLMKQPV